MSPRRRTALVLLAALLGIAVAAAITYGTSQLVSQHIGLASEPITAGRALLAPAVRRAPATPARTSSSPAGGSVAPREPRATTPAEAAPASEAPATSSEAPAAIREAPAASPEAPPAPSAEHPRAGSGAGGTGGDGHAQGDD